MIIVIIVVINNINNYYISWLHELRDVYTVVVEYIVGLHRSYTNSSRDVLLSMTSCNNCCTALCCRLAVTINITLLIALCFSLLVIRSVSITFNFDITVRNYS